MILTAQSKNNTCISCHVPNKKPCQKGTEWCGITVFLTYSNSGNDNHCWRNQDFTLKWHLFLRLSCIKSVFPLTSEHHIKWHGTNVKEYSNLSSLFYQSSASRNWWSVTVTLLVYMFPSCLLKLIKSSLNKVKHKHDSVWKSDLNSHRFLGILCLHFLLNFRFDCEDISNTRDS